jgi:hypothetical protein
LLASCTASRETLHMTIACSYRSSLSVLFFALSAAACSDSSNSSAIPDAQTEVNPVVDLGIVDAIENPGLDASDTTSTPTPCEPDTSSQLICEPSKVKGIPLGPVVTIAKGTGQPPAAAGGTIVPGDYQLASETVYGNVPADVSVPRLGLQIQRILHVEGDVMNEGYLATSESSSGGGNDCSRLAPRALSLLEVARGCVPNSVSYTMRGSTLVLMFLSPYYLYVSPCNGLFEVLGSYTRVDEFVPVGEAQANPPASTSVDAGSPAVTWGRDPRCPDSPPSSGDPCTPDPAPLGCEYGGDAWRSCTTLALCEMDQLDGSFRFQVTSPSPCTPPNPPACPASFSAASALASTIVDAGTGGAVDAAGAGLQPDLYCSYAEGVCACVRLHGPLYRCMWTCFGGVASEDGGTSSCPWPRPLAGDSCSPGLQCNYVVQCAPDYVGEPRMICPSGHWEQWVTYTP